MEENPSRKRIDEILSSADLHKIVGVKPGASKEEMKRAYYKTSLLVHPDKTSEKGASEAFVKLSNAYEDLREGRRTSKYQTSSKPEPSKAPKTQKKRTTEPGSFDEIFNNFFQKKKSNLSSAEIKQNNARIMNWYYKNH